MTIPSTSWKLGTEPEVDVPDGLHPVPSSTLCAVPEPSLEVVPPYHDNTGRTNHHETDLSNRVELPCTSDRHSKDETDELLLSPKPRSRRRLLLIAAVISTMIVVGTVLGGVLGSRALRTEKAAESASTPSGQATLSTIPSSTTATITTSTPKPSHTLKSIAANSPLKATSLLWPRRERFEMVLAFLSPDGHLRYVSRELDPFSSAFGVKPQSEWNFPKELNSSLEIGKNAQLQFSSSESLISLMYTDSESRIKGWQSDTLLTEEVPNGFFEDDAIGKRNLTIASDSAIGAYGSLTVYQATDGDLSITSRRENCATGNFTFTSPKSLKISAMQGTKLAVVPLSTDELTVEVGAIAVFFQDEERRIKVFRGSVGLMNGTNFEEDSDPEMDAWTSKGFPDITLPKGHNFAAFLWNTFEQQFPTTAVVLYQDENGDIQQAMTQGEGQWHTSSPKALAGADFGTDITCVIKVMRNCWSGGGIRLMSTAAGRFQRADHYRCFFWRNRAVVEVRLDATTQMRPGHSVTELDWVEVGPVSLL